MEFQENTIQDLFEVLEDPLTTPTIPTEDNNSDTLKNTLLKLKKCPEILPLAQYKSILDKAFPEETNYIKNTKVPKPITSFEHIAEITNEFVDYLINTEAYSKNSNDTKQRFLLQNKTYFPEQETPSMSKVDKTLLKQCFTNNENYTFTKYNLWEVKEKAFNEFQSVYLLAYLIKNSNILQSITPMSLGISEFSKISLSYPLPRKISSKTLLPCQVIPGTQNHSVVMAVGSRVYEPLTSEHKIQMHSRRSFVKPKNQPLGRLLAKTYTTLPMANFVTNKNVSIQSKPHIYLANMATDLMSVSNLKQEHIHQWAKQLLGATKLCEQINLEVTLGELTDPTSKVYQNTNSSDNPDVTLYTKELQEALDHMVFRYIMTRVTNNAYAKYLELFPINENLQSEFLELIMLKLEVFISLVQEMTYIPAHDEYYRSLYSTLPKNSVEDFVRSFYRTSLAEDITFMYNFMLLRNLKNHMTQSDFIPESLIENTLLDGYLRNESLYDLSQSASMDLQTRKPISATENMLGKNAEVYTWISKTVMSTSTEQGQGNDLAIEQGEKWIDTFIKEYKALKNNKDNYISLPKPSLEVIKTNVPINVFDPEEQITGIQNVHIMCVVRDNLPKLGMFPKTLLVLRSTKGTGYSIPILIFYDEAEIKHYLVPSTHTMADIIFRMYGIETNPKLPTGGTYVSLFKSVLSSVESSARQLTSILRYSECESKDGYVYHQEVTHFTNSIRDAVNYPSEGVKGEKEGESSTEDAETFQELKEIFTKYTSMMHLAKVEPAIKVHPPSRFSYAPQSNLSYLGKVNLAKFLNVLPTEETDLDSKYTFYMFI
jgi:hypothetical protein